MHHPSDLSDLDAVTGYAAASLGEMGAELRRVADRRLEEEPNRPRIVGFYFTAVAWNWRNVVQAVRHAEPWLLPFRLSRLTIAALSIIFLLPTTAEIWEIAASNRLSVLALLAAGALLATSAFVIKRQRLFLGRPGRLAEQAVVTRVSVSCIVILGLVSTFALLLFLSLGLGTTLFPAELVARWIGGEPADVEHLTYARVAVLLSSIGLVIGALGASFEDQQFVRHVAYVDEEV